MTHTELKAREFRLPLKTTPEDLACAWDYTVDFGDRVLLAGYFYKGRYEPSYFAAIYQHLDDDLSCEGDIELIEVSDEFFSDNGHALQWAMMN